MTSQGWLLVFQQCHLYLVLLPVGFSSVHCYQQNRCALTTPFHPCHVMAVYFLWHCPQGFPRQVLPGTVSLQSPDFPLLTIKAISRSSGKFNLQFNLRISTIIIYDFNKFLSLIILAFQRRFRQELINSKIDQECLLISQNLAKKLN